MVGQNTTTKIEYWLKEGMKLWHVLPLFLGLALIGWFIAQSLATVVPVDPGLSERMIASAGLFGGYAMGWIARREHEQMKD